MTKRVQIGKRFLSTDLSGLLSFNHRPFLVEWKDWSEGRVKSCTVLYREQDWAILQDLQTGLGWNSLLWACCASPIPSPSEFSVAAILFLLLHLGMWGCVSLILRWSYFQNHSQFLLICERVGIFCMREYNLWPQTVLWLQIL